MRSTLPNLAFLHGGGQGSWAWRETIDAIVAQDGQHFRKIVALDVPGCGEKRERDTECLTPADVASELIADLGTEGMSDIVLVGHSLAGNLLPAMAQLRPDMFRRLVYLSCSIPLPGQTVLEMMGNGVHGSNPDEVGWPVDPGAVAMRDRYSAMYFEDMKQEQIDEFLANLDLDNWPYSFFSNTKFDFDMLKVPSIYVLCRNDRILPASWQEEFARRFKVARVVHLDAGHQAMMTRPHGFAEILRLEPVGAA